MNRTIIAAVAFSAISLFTTNIASAQSYHRSFRHLKMDSSAIAEANESRLQVSLRQPDKATLKFQISVLNPTGRAMNISIQRNDDVLFAENFSGDQYFNLFNMSELEDGDYKFVVFNGKDRIVKTIHLQTATTVDRQISIN